MEKTVKIGNGSLRLRASAATPRLYRSLFNRDIFIDYSKIIEGINSEFNGEQLEIFENMAFTMAKQADNSISNDVFEWLETIDEVFTIYNLLPHVIELWNGNTETHSEAKKKVN